MIDINKNISIHVCDMWNDNGPTAKHGFIMCFAHRKFNGNFNEFYLPSLNIKIIDKTHAYSDNIFMNIDYYSIIEVIGIFQAILQADPNNRVTYASGKTKFEVDKLYDQLSNNTTYKIAMSKSKLGNTLTHVFKENVFMSVISTLSNMYNNMQSTSLDVIKVLQNNYMIELLEKLNGISMAINDNSKTIPQAESQQILTPQVKTETIELSQPNVTQIDTDAVHNDMNNYINSVATNDVNINFLFIQQYIESLIMDIKNGMPAIKVMRGFIATFDNYFMCMPQNMTKSKYFDFDNVDISNNKMQLLMNVLCESYESGNELPQDMPISFKFKSTTDINIGHRMVASFMFVLYRVSKNPDVVRFLSSCMSPFWQSYLIANTDQYTFNGCIENIKQSNMLNVNDFNLLSLLNANMNSAMIGEYDVYINKVIATATPLQPIDEKPKAQFIDFDGKPISSQPTTTPAIEQTNSMETTVVSTETTQYIECDSNIYNWLRQREIPADICKQLAETQSYMTINTTAENINSMVDTQLCAVTIINGVDANITMDELDQLYTDAMKTFNYDLQKQIMETTMFFE